MKKGLDEIDWAMIDVAVSNKQLSEGDRKLISKIIDAYEEEAEYRRRLHEIVMRYVHESTKVMLSTKDVLSAEKLDVALKKILSRLYTFTNDLKTLSDEYDDEK